MFEPVRSAHDQFEPVRSAHDHFFKLLLQNHAVQLTLLEQRARGEG